MEKHGKLVVLLVILLAVAAGGLFLFSSGGGNAPLDVGSSASAGATGALSAPSLQAPANAVPAAGPGRSTVEVAGAPPAQDPEITAALAKFTGRVVSHDGKPAPERRVRLFRIDPQVALLPGVSMLSEPVADFADAFAGDTNTGADGRFELAGVWPRSIYMLKADADGPNPTLRLTERTPGPGDTVDLGDIALKNAAVATGIVVDDSGKPVAGAMVRAADIPAIATQLVPVELFDPDGWFIVSERSARMVIEMPAWAKRIWKELPVPTTFSGADGRFRLEGIEPGVNLVAAVKSGFVAATQKNVKFDAGQTRDVGKLKLGEGEVASGRVVDQQGKPIAGVQVVVGNRLNAVPIVFGRDAGKTDDRGAFQCSGLGNSDVVAAARRGPGEPWLITEPQSIQKDIVVTLPSRHTLTVRLVSEAGLALASPRLRLLHFGEVTGQSELSMFAQLGVARAVPLDARQTKMDDGRIQLRDLDAGNYALVAGAAGHAPSLQNVELTGDREVEARLSQEQAIDVVVVDESDKPIRNASVYVELRGKGPDTMPQHAGHTGADGKLRVREVNRESAIVEAVHPRYGAVAANVTLPATAPVLIKMHAPSAIAGEVTENGKPPELGKYTALAQRPWGEVRGPVSGMPAMAVLDADGKFSMRGLQPGPCRVEIIKSLQAMQSFSSLMEMGMMARFAGDLPERDVQLVAGQTTQVRLETNAPRVVEGPSARVSGTVFVDGRAGEGMLVNAWNEQRVSAVVDASGQFDLGQVKEGTTHLRLIEKPGEGMAFFNESLWSRAVEVKANADVTLRIEVTTGSLVGFVLDLDGRPAGAAQVSARGTIAGGDRQTAQAGGSTITDEEGRFELRRLPAGSYSVECDGGKRGRGTASATVTTGNQSEVRVQLARTFTLRGKLDRKALPVERQEEAWLWLALEPQAGAQLAVRNQGSSVEPDGTFSIDNVIAGSYKMHIYGSFQGQWLHDGVIDITRDIDSFEVRPVQMQQPPPSQAKPKQDKK